MRLAHSSPGRRRLARKLLLPVFACVVLVVACAHFFVQQTLEASMQQRSIERARSLLHAIEAAANTTHGDAELQHFVSSMAEESDVEHIVVVEPGRPRVLASSDRAWQGRAVHELPSPWSELLAAQPSPSGPGWVFAEGHLTGRIASKSASLRRLGHSEEGGLIHVVLSTANIAESRDRLATRLGTASVVLLLGLTVFASLRVRRHVLRPLAALLASCRDAGNGAEPGPEHGCIDPRDEIGALARTLHETVAALRDNEARLRGLLASIGDGILVVDHRGCIETANPKVHEIFGYAPGALIGQNVTLLTPPCVRERHAQWIEALPAREDRDALFGRPLEVHGARASGELFPIELTLAETRVSSSPLYTACIRDISDRKRLEAERDRQAADMREAYAVLETATASLASTTQELEEARLSAEEANAAKSAFLANMSHEIRTPMTAILGYAELLHDESLSHGERHDFVRTIAQNGEHLLGLLNDILDLSKIESGHVEIEETSIAPRQLLADIQRLLSVRAHAKGLRLQVDCDDTVPTWIRSDSLRLRQILANLIGNALKFTEEGAIRVHASHDVHFDTPMLRIDVEDDGIGMSANEARRLFATFSQANAATARRYGGTGLGLVISRKLAQLLGGNVELLRSEPGVGSVFRLTVVARPAIAEAPGLAPPVRPQPKGDGPIGRVLLAEDGPDNQRLLRRILEKAGATLTLVENGRDAVTAIVAAEASPEPFDLVLMDVQMPILGGIEAVGILREHGFDGPIVALTANAMAGDRERYLAAGCNAYEAKPIVKARLLATCRDWSRARTRTAEAAH